MSPEPADVRTDALIDHIATAAARAKDWTRQRDEAIVAAVAAGMSQREAARAAGLSHTRVQQIIRQATGAVD